MTVELEELRSQLATERTEHGVPRRGRARPAALRRARADLAAQACKARRDLDDGERACGDLESRLRLTSSELAVTKTALAIATANVRALQQAHGDWWQVCDAMLSTLGRRCDTLCGEALAMSHNLRGTRSSLPIDRGSDARKPALGPGKQTLVEQVQRRDTGAVSGDGHAADARDVAKPPQPLPFGDLIQRAFGRHGEHASAGGDGELQRKSAGDGPREGGPMVGAALASPSQPLDADTRGLMESKLKQDFSGVRVHADDTAAAGAASVQARAFTVGRDIVFGSGQYQPHSAEGRRLLAHELTHVVQQGGGGRAPEVARAASADRRPRGGRRAALDSRAHRAAVRRGDQAA